APPGQPAPKPPEKPHLQSKPRRRIQLPAAPVLRFSPTAWAKLLYFRDRRENEIGGFGVASAEDLLRIEDFVTVRQEVTVASVAFDDQAVADFFERQVDAGRRPEQFGRIWLHTHPGNSPEPSGTDEETFQRVFGACQWAVMFVLGRGGKSYARLRFNVGPGGSVVLPVEVDFERPFGPSRQEVWEAEYQTHVIPGALSWGDDLPYDESGRFGACTREALASHSVPDDWLAELEAMEPAERQLILDELAARPDLWDEQEVANEF
ncbi:MAG TPA: hypothetical protein DCX07_02050, partial [Phycisphaerales bacterium]|nr:hypothetical protein [Phycisphaerales bacterium]